MMRKWILVSSFVLGCSGGTTGDDGGMMMSSGDSGSMMTSDAGMVGDYSCVLATTSNCVDYVGSAYRNPNRKTVEQMGCTASKGTFQDGMQCSTMNRAGTCIMNEGTATELHKRYYAPKTAMQAQSDCMLANQGMGGRFVPN